MSLNPDTKKINESAPPWHALEPEEVLTALETTTDGLSKEDVEKRQERLGLNIFTEVPPKGLLRRIADQLRSPLVAVLVIAFLITVALDEYVDATVIALALTIAVTVGIAQEGRASRAFRHLVRSQEHKATVVREGKQHVIPAEELVPGDIVEVQSGMQVPSDLRLLSEKKLSVNESVLTGEWQSVTKRPKEVAVGVPLAERTSMAYMGTFVAVGYGEGVVVAIGDRTAVGQLAQAVQQIEDETTPIQLEMQRISRIMLVIIAALVTIIFMLGIWRGGSLEEMLLTSIAIAVASIPEGLPAAVTIILAVGMEAILKRGGLVRNLLAAETLGSTTYILTDKTGTLTEARMVVTELVHIGHRTTVDTPPLSWKEDPMIIAMFDAALCATSAFMDEYEDGTESFSVRGEPMERAILEAAHEVGVSLHGESLRGRRIDYLAFTSENRFAAGLAKTLEGRKLCINGAPEYLLELSSSVHTAKGVEKLTERSKDFFLRTIDEHTKRGERIMAVGYKDVSWDDIPDDADENILAQMIFMGLIIFHDPVREGVAEAVHDVVDAGAKIRLVTGDNPQTALTIAESVGIAKAHDTALSGSDIEQMDDATLLSAIQRTPVFARVLPSQKMRLVSILEAQGEIVAMTGDGINDAPALRKANIGIAIGSGTEVAKEASDLVLMKDSFATLRYAIEEGRRIVSNLRKIVGYLLATSLSEAVVIGGALLSGAALPILPSQILWANIIEEGFMSVAFAFEVGEKDAMKQKPQDVHGEGVLSREMMRFMGLVVTILGVLLLLLYVYLRMLGLPIEELRSVMFLAISVDSLFIAFSFRSLSTPVWKIPFKTNLFFLGSFALNVVLLGIVISVPFFQYLLSYTPLPLTDIALVFLYGFSTLVVIEIGKWLFFERQGVA